MMLSTEIHRALEARFGLRTRADWDTSLEAAVAAVRDRFGTSESAAERLLAEDERVLAEFAGYFTVGESHFFRHRQQLETVALGIRDRLERGAEQVTLWSAGCCRGEEAYSVLMVAASLLTRPQLERVRVLASDMNGQALEIGRAGVYEKWSLRGMTDLLLTRHFEALGNGRWRVAERYRTAVSFTARSIDEHRRIMPPSSVDLILFRNVGIYLTTAALEESYRGFRTVLRSDGMLVIAPTDPQPPASLFLRSGIESSAYAPQPSQGYLSCPGEHKDAAKSAPRRTVRREGEDSIPAAMADGNGKSHDSLRRARLLANGREYDEAEAIIAAHLVLEPRSVDGYLLRGQVSFERGEVLTAVQAFERAVGLGPDKFLARYWYILALRAAAKIVRATAELEIIHGQLRLLPSNALLEDGRTSVRELLLATDEVKGAMT